MALGRSTAVATAVGAVAGVAAVAALAATDRPQLKSTRAGQALAKATVVRSGDLPGIAWKGGPAKPDLEPPTCRNYAPKQSDLVLNGIASSRFQRQPISVSSQSQVLQSARMVALDWRRSIAAPGAGPCFRALLGKSITGGSISLFGKVDFPQVAPYTVAYRAVVSGVVQGKTLRFVIDLVFLGKGRSEISMTNSASYAARGTLAALERRLARKLVARIPG